MSDVELLQGLLNKLYYIIKILKYDLKTDEKVVYERDAKEILEMLGEKYE